MKTRKQDKTPSVEPQPPPRTSRKRRASSASASEASVEPTTASSESQTKRRKQTTKSTTTTHPELEPVQEDGLEETVQVAPRHVHFDEDEEEGVDKSTASNITPHPRKHTVHRRVTLSPAELRSGVKLPDKSHRASLPGALAVQEETAEGNFGIDFVPLRELIQQRVQKRLSERPTLLQLDGTEDADMEEDMMVYSGHEKRVVYPKIPSQFLTLTRSVETVNSERATSIDPQANAKAEVERQAFEDAIRKLTREASDARAALQILTIEVQSLGFGGEDVDAKSVLTSIRESFQVVRDNLQVLLPDGVPVDASNSEIVDLINTHISALTQEVETQKGVIGDLEDLQRELAKEINALIDRLTERDIRITKLEEANGEFAAQGSDDEGYIKEMEKRLIDIGKQHEHVAGLLVEKESQHATLVREHDDLERSLKKRDKVLEDYRQSEQRLQTMITRMEEEHNVALVKVEDDWKEEVKRVQAEMDEEVAKRETVEVDADEKQTFITELQNKLEETETTLEQLRDQLQDSKEAHAAEQGARAEAEQDRDQKTTFITELEDKVQQAEDELASLEEKLEQLRTLSENEKQQRESAEEALDESDNKIRSLDDKLHKAGIEANELRQKLFEVQQRESRTAKEMETAATEREDQYQHDMEDEVARREKVEEDVAERDQTITDLQDQLVALEDSMAQAIAERDGDIDGLQRKTQSLEQELDAQLGKVDEISRKSEGVIADKDEEITGLRDDLAGAESESIEKTRTITSLHKNAKESVTRYETTISDRESQINDLNKQLDEADETIAGLEKEKGSLERRVESEAEAMLELQAAKDDEIAELQRSVREKQLEVQDLGRKATEVDSRWTDLVEVKDAEILDLAQTSTERHAIINGLRQENEDVRALLRRFVKTATETTATMRAELEAVRNAAVERDAELQDEGRKVLEEAESLRAGEVIETVTHVQTGPVHVINKKTKKVKRSSVMRDSGVVVDDSMIGG